MTEYPLIVYVVAIFAALLIGFAKGGLGGMLGALATPLMALVLPPEEVLGLMLPLLMVADVFAVATHWKKWSGRLVGLLLPGAVLGVTIGTYFISNAPTRTLKVALGVIVLVFALYKFVEQRLKRQPDTQSKGWHGALAGTLAGFTSSLAHAGGPPVAIYLLYQDITPRAFVATSALFFMLLNWVKVPYYVASGLLDLEQFLHFSWVLPILPLGVWLGKWLTTRVDKAVFERIVVWLLVITAVMLIIG